MHTFASHASKDADTLAALVDLAQRDLPSVADHGVVAMLSGDADISCRMLSLVFEEALRADCGYLAELADRALGSIERNRRTAG